MTGFSARFSEPQKKIAAILQWDVGFSLTFQTCFKQPANEPASRILRNCLSKPNSYILRCPRFQLLFEATGQLLPGYRESSSMFLGSKRRLTRDAL
jgi:hypothetical protein